MVKSKMLKVPLTYSTVWWQKTLKLRRGVQGKVVIVGGDLDNHSLIPNLSYSRDSIRHT